MSIVAEKTDKKFVSLRAIQVANGQYKGGSGQTERHTSIAPKSGHVTAKAVSQASKVLIIKTK